MDVKMVITEVVITDKTKRVTSLVTIKEAKESIVLTTMENVALIMEITAIMRAVEVTINHAIMVVKVVSATTNLTATTQKAVIILIINIVKRNKLNIKNSLLTTRNLCV